MELLRQKNNNIFLQIKNSTNIGNAQYSNLNTHINSFEFNIRTKELNEYFKPNNNVPMTPKDLYPNQQKQQKGFFLGNFNNVNPNFITNINPNNNLNNGQNFIANNNPNNNFNNNPNNNFNNNPNFKANINGIITPNNQYNFVERNIVQNNIRNERYENQQGDYYNNEITPANKFNRRLNGIQDEIANENIIKNESCSLYGNNDNLKIPTEDILKCKNPQYMEKYYENNKEEGFTEFMVENNILNNNNNQNNDKYINYNVLNGPTKDMQDKALNKGNNSEKVDNFTEIELNNGDNKYDEYTEKALNKTLGFNINNNNGNAPNAPYIDQLSFINKKKYQKINNGNSNQMLNNINLMNNNSKNIHSRNFSSTRRTNGLNTEENYWNNDANKTRDSRSVDRNSMKDSFSKTFFMNGNISGDQIAFMKFKNGMK